MVFGLPFFLLSAGIVMICAAYSARNQRTRNAPVDEIVSAAIRQVAREVDADIRECSHKTLRATVQGLRLECGYRWVTDDPSGPADRFEVTLVDSGRRLIPLNLTIDRHLAIPAHLLVRRDCLTGDVQFDQVVNLSGPPVLTEALLCSQVRATVLDLMSTGTLQVELRNVTWFIATERIADGGDLSHRIRQVIDLASRLRLDRDDVPRRLAENALGDPVAAVRARNFDALLDHFPDAEVTAQTASSLLAVEIPALRLRAARFLGTPEATVALQSLLDEPEAGDEIHVSALEALATLLPPHDLTPLLERILAPDDVDRSLRLAATRVIAGRGLKDAVPCLVAVIPVADHELMNAIANVLVALGDASAEPALLSQLDTEVEPTRIAIVRALGAVGTSAAVEPLLPLAKGYFRSPELKKAVRETIASIQGRLHGAGQGQLSLAEHPDRQGALSLSGEEGRLTIADEPTDDEGRPPAPAE